MNNIILEIRKLRKLIKGFIRCRIYTFCPRCNSDAPAKQYCKICKDFYGHPQKWRRIEWWIKYKEYVNEEYKFKRDNKNN